MQRLKVLHSLVVENAGKLRELPDRASVPPPPSGASVHSCLTSTPDDTVVVPDELVFRTWEQRSVTRDHFQQLVAIMPPAQVWFSVHTVPTKAFEGLSCVHEWRTATILYLHLYLPLGMHSAYMPTAMSNSHLSNLDTVLSRVMR
jgi:hypothetical protein